MKRLFILVILIAASSVISLAQEDINYFEVSSNIVTPVKVKTNLGTFYIYSGESKRVDGHISSIVAYDANGNQIVNNTPYKTETGTGKPTVKYWRFTLIYENQSGTIGGGSVPQGKSSGGAEVANKFDKKVRELIVVPMDGYPNLQVRAGASFSMAEYASLKAELGEMGGYVLAGGIGKSLFDKDENGKSWYAAVGYYAGDEMFNITFNIALLSSHITNSLGLVGELEFSYFFEEVSRLGLYADLQFGVSITSERFLFNAGVGVAWKLFSD